MSKHVQVIFHLGTHHKDITALIVHTDVRPEYVKVEGRGEQTTVPEPTIALGDKQAFPFENV